MKKILAGLFVVGSLFGMSACTNPDPIVGVVEGKYIEDRHEYTVIIKEDGSGDIHHFAIEDDDWRSLNVGDRYNSRNFDQPADD